MDQIAFLTDLFNRRNSVSIGFNNVRFLELTGGEIVEPTAFEPDPATYRGEYYYNAVTNVLHRKVVTNQQAGIIAAYWQRISQ